MATDELRGLITTNIPDSGPAPISAADVREVLTSVADAVDAPETTHELISNGSATITLPHAYIPGSLKIHRWGIRIKKSDITETSITQFTLAFTPDSGDELIIDYKQK